MNYYIQGDAANADRIRAAFEEKGISDGGNSFIHSNYLYFSEGGEVDFCGIGGHIANIIKTHPNYKELELPVEPKFKVNAWIVSNITKDIYQVKAVPEYFKLQAQGQYRLQSYTDGSISYFWKNDVENTCRLWETSDAKVGDVLATNYIICIFKKLDKDGYYIISPCIYTVKDGLEVIDDETDSIGSCGFKPATKEDRDLLFRKIKEAGYQWDADKKELRKIQPHYDIANFKEGMPVLAREYDTCVWQWVQYSHFNGVGLFFAAGKTWRQCIPFNKDTKHLLGTTDMPSEEYINW